MPEALPSTTPEPYTNAANASDTLQAQHVMANDSPVDVNNNSILARLQGQCTARVGEEFAAAAARRTIIADAALKTP